MADSTIIDGELVEAEQRDVLESLVHVLVARAGAAGAQAA
jgi:hypothetical protein